MRTGAYLTIETGTFEAAMRRLEDSLNSRCDRIESWLKDVSGKTTQIELDQAKTLGAAESRKTDSDRNHNSVTLRISMVGILVTIAVVIIQHFWK